MTTIAHDAETVTVSMPSADPDAPVVDYVYDGRAIREVRQGQAPSDAPPEAGADAWIGRFPFELFSASDWRAPLVALLGVTGYLDAQATFGTAGPMEAHGDWVAGSGCQAGACGAAWGAVAIHRTDGRLLVALGRFEGEPRLWGDPAGPLPLPIAEVMAGAPGTPPGPGGPGFNTP